MSNINLINTLPKIAKPVSFLISSQENTAGLSYSRFIQDTTTNWVPKAGFARSKADFAEMSFLEFGESALFYFAPALLGEKVFRKLYTKKLPSGLKSQISKPANELLSNKNLFTKKAAIALACFSIPIAEYALSFAKNLFTLKVFKTADFENIANLKQSYSDKKKAQKVKNNAEKNLLGSAIAALGCISGSLILALKGKNSKVLQKLSEYILIPGQKITKNIKSEKLKKAATKYFSFDFANKKEKLALSHGQLTTSVLFGVAGYLLAAKDRGKQNFLEDLSRVPLVAFYTIVGSSLLEQGFKKYLAKKPFYKNLIDKELKVPKLNEISGLAKKIAENQGTDQVKEFKKIFKGKAIITGVPFLFSLLVMGAATSGLTRFWTKYRYKHGQKVNNQSRVNVPCLYEQKNKSYNKTFAGFMS